MKALLVVDMLEDFFQKGPLKAKRDELAQNINTLTSAARELSIPVIWIRQEFRYDLQDAFLVMRKQNIRITIADTEGCRILHELKRAPGDHEIIKKRYSAFFETGLDALLEELKVNHVIIAGINTHACVRMAAIDAYQRDLEVTIPRQCVASYNAQHHDITLEYLEGSIAKVSDLQESLRALRRGRLA